MELTILMPCLNEAETVALCVRKAVGFLERHGLDGEVLVADNGSTDGSQDLARGAGARVVEVRDRGYGAALMGGVRAAKGRYVIMGDADDSYDFGRLEPFLEKLREGNQLVMGNRFRGGIVRGAMPPLHRYLGNPVLSFLGRLFFRLPIGDFHCGLRGFDKQAIERLGLATPGMEFASEMVVKSGLAGYRIAEVPTTLSPDGRSRRPHLRTWRDGWRHLRFLLIHAPRWLFLYPGLALAAIGMLGMTALLFGPVRIGRVTFDIHTLLFCAASVQIGMQMVFFAALGRSYGVMVGVLPPSKTVDRFTRIFSLEIGVLGGVAMILVGLLLAAASVLGWAGAGLHDVNPERMMRLVIPATLCIVLGGQFVINSFFFALLKSAPIIPSARLGEAMA
jgi:glycosyltransferase involved in cell wall biosynthesis